MTKTSLAIMGAIGLIKLVILEPFIIVCNIKKSILILLLFCFRVLVTMSSTSDVWDENNIFELCHERTCSFCLQPHNYQFSNILQ